MEVHHHAHHEKKNWKSYFWEFLMLFFAVTLGFFVENQREHYIEHFRAKEFSRTLSKDLHNDTAAIRRQMRIARTYIAFVDSLVELSKTKLEDKNAAQFSFYTRFMYWTGPIIWNRATFDQIKSSGSLRYFKNNELLEKLTKYEALVNDIQSEAYNHIARGNLLLHEINQIIDPFQHHEYSKYYLEFVDTMSAKTKETMLASFGGSLEDKRSEIKQMLNMIIVQQRNLQRDMNVTWHQAELLAIELIDDLKKEYHVE